MSDKIRRVFQTVGNLWEDPKLTVSNPLLYPSIDVLEKDFEAIVERCSKGGVENKKIYRLEDADGSVITVKELLEKYFGNPESCFTKPNK